MGKKLKVMCPNCGGEAERMEKDGGIYILCPKEDKIFQLTATGAKLAGRGKLHDLESRLAALEAKLNHRDTPEQDPPDEPAGDDDDDGTDLELTFDDD